MNKSFRFQKIITLCSVEMKKKMYLRATFKKAPTEAQFKSSTSEEILFSPLYFASLDLRLAATKSCVLPNGSSFVNAAFRFVFFNLYFLYQVLSCQEFAELMCEEVTRYFSQLDFSSLKKITIMVTFAKMQLLSWLQSIIFLYKETLTTPECIKKSK